MARIGNLEQQQSEIATRIRELADRVETGELTVIDFNHSRGVAEMAPTGSDRMNKFSPSPDEWLSFHFRRNPKK